MIYAGGAIDSGIRLASLKKEMSDLDVEKERQELQLTRLRNTGKVMNRKFAAGMEKRQRRHSLDIRKTHPFHALIIKFFRKKILFYLILYLNLRRKIPERGLHVTIY